MWMPAPCLGLIDLLIQTEMEGVLSMFIMRALWLWLWKASKCIMCITDAYFKMAVNLSLLNKE